MRCETCQGTGRSCGPDCIAKRFSDHLPCPDCGGSGISHCCDGIQEQRDPGDETHWPDRLGEMERDVTGCADDCCHPSHKHLGAPGILGKLAYAACLTWAPRDINWSGAWRQTLEKATEFNAIADTHDEWRSLNNDTDPGF